MLEDNLQILPGHLQIQAPGYFQDPSLQHSLRWPNTDLLDLLEAEPAITGWTPRLVRQVMVQSERVNSALLLIGVDPERDAMVSFFAEQPDLLRKLDDPNEAKVLLGRSAVKRLKTAVGRRIVVTTQDHRGDLAESGLTVVGQFVGLFESLENRYAFAHIATVQRLTGLASSASFIAVKTEDYSTSEGLGKRLAAALGPDLHFISWRQLDPYLQGILQLMNAVVIIWAIIVFIAMAFGLINAMAMAVFERTAEFGLVQALGWRPSQVVWVVMLEAMMLLIIGISAGSLLAWAIALPMQGGVELDLFAEGLKAFGSRPVLYPTLILKDVIIIDVLVLLCGLLASLSPALSACRLKPTDAIRSA